MILWSPASAQSQLSLAAGNLSHPKVPSPPFPISQGELPLSRLTLTTFFLDSHVLPGRLRGVGV